MWRQADARRYRYRRCRCRDGADAASCAAAHSFRRLAHVTVATGTSHRYRLGASRSLCALPSDLTLDALLDSRPQRMSAHSLVQPI